MNTAMSWGTIMRFQRALQRWRIVRSVFGIELRITEGDALRREDYLVPGRRETVLQIRAKCSVSVHASPAGTGYWEN